MKNVAAIPTKIAGVTFADPATGINRQEIIRNYVRSGDPLRIALDDDIPGHPEAVAIWFDRNGTQYHIGYLYHVQAVRVRKALQRGDNVEAMVKDVTGGTDDSPTLGVNIVIGLPVTKQELRNLAAEGQTYVLQKRGHRMGCLKIAGAVGAIVIVFGILATIFGESNDSGTEVFTPVPTFTNTPVVVVVATELGGQLAPTSVPSSEIELETAKQVLSMLLAQQAASTGLQDLATEGDASLNLASLTVAGSFAAAARDAAGNEYPTAVMPHIQAIRDNAVLLDSLMNRWSDGELDSVQVLGLLTEVDVGADITAFGEALRAAGYSDTDLSQLVDEIQASIVAQEN